jgi:hypothetical protein
MTTRLAIVLAGFALATAPPARSADEMLLASRSVASQLTQQLAAELKKALASGGPAGAIGVCRDIAPALAASLSRQTGARIARVSLRTRNPLLGAPDAWEQAVLAEFAQRAAAGEKLETLERHETVTEPAGRYFRYMKAIPVQPVCLACHGTQDQLAPEVQERLRTEYPHDNATGYAPGQIRGAVTVKQPLQ